MFVNKISFVWLKWAVSLVIIYLLFDKADFVSLFGLIKNIKIELVAVAFILQLLHVFVASFRWNIILKKFYIYMEFVHVVKYQWIGFFFNQAMPSNIGGDAFRVYYLTKNNWNIHDSALTVLLDRVVGLLGLILLVLATVPILLYSGIDSVMKWGFAIAVLILVVTVSMIFIFDMITSKLLHWKIIRLLNSISKNGRNLLFNKKYGVKIVILSLIIHLISVLTFITLSESMGLNIEMTSILLITPVATLLMVVPISVAGWGIREGAMVVGLGYYGVPTESALVLSIMYGVMMLVVSLPGGLIWSMLDASLKKVTYRD